PAWHFPPLNLARDLPARAAVLDLLLFVHDFPCTSLRVSVLPRLLAPAATLAHRLRGLGVFNVPDLLERLQFWAFDRDPSSSPARSAADRRASAPWRRFDRRRTAFFDLRGAPRELLSLRRRRWHLLSLGAQGLMAGSHARSRDGGCCGTPRFPARRPSTFSASRGDSAVGGVSNAAHGQVSQAVGQRS